MEVPPRPQFPKRSGWERDIHQDPTSPDTRKDLHMPAHRRLSGPYGNQAATIPPLATFRLLVTSHHYDKIREVLHGSLRDMAHAQTTVHRTVPHGYAQVSTTTRTTLPADRPRSHAFIRILTKPTPGHLPKSFRNPDLANTPNLSTPFP